MRTELQWHGGWDEAVSRRGRRVYGDLSDKSEALRAAFLESGMEPWDAGPCAGCALDLALGFAEVVALGGTMRWDAQVVGHLARVWAPGTARSDCGALQAMPRVLSALVRFVHVREGVDAGTTLEVACEIQEAEKENAARIARGDEDGFPEWPIDAVLGDPSEAVRRRLAASVGGPEALDSLDAAPLPDEPFSWAGIAEDIRERVGEYLLLLDEVADERLDIEHRTAMRRSLARAAIGDPNMFRRASSVVRGAAGLAFAVCEANDTIASYRKGANAKVLGGWFGLDGGASDRSSAMRRAIGAPRFVPPSYLRVPPPLGAGDLLVSARRAAIIAERDASECDAGAWT